MLPFIFYSVFTHCKHKTFALNFRVSLLPNRFILFTLNWWTGFHRLSQRFTTKRKMAEVCLSECHDPVVSLSLMVQDVSTCGRFWVFCLESSYSLYEKGTTSVRWFQMVAAVILSVSFYVLDDNKSCVSSLCRRVTAVKHSFPARSRCCLWKYVMTWWSYHLTWRGKRYVWNMDGHTFTMQSHTK